MYVKTKELGRISVCTNLVMSVRLNYNSFGPRPEDGATLGKFNLFRREVGGAEVREVYIFSENCTNNWHVVVRSV